MRVGDTLALYEEMQTNDDLVRYITLPYDETVVLISTNISTEEIIDTAKGILGESKATLYIGEVSDLNRDPRIIFARKLLPLNVVVPSYLPAGVQLKQFSLFTGTRGMAGVACIWALKLTTCQRKRFSQRRHSTRRRSARGI